MKLKKKTDQWVGVIFLVLTGLFIVAMTYESFFEWAFARHQNQLSWYSRPLFLIPYCYFAFRRSLAGVAISIFALFTSMFWFPVPDYVPPQVSEFLAFEKKYLTQDWTVKKMFLALTIPLSLYFLALAFWKRNLWFGITVVVLMAVGKIIWSIQEAGESGQSILVPAVIGLVITLLIVLLGVRRPRQ